jgi:hypothetical protein
VDNDRRLEIYVLGSRSLLLHTYMTFTDDDLKRLKEAILVCKVSNGRLVTEDLDAVESLLSRLEAAEVSLLTFWSVADFDRFPALDGPFNAWRKAAGK